MSLGSEASPVPPAASRARTWPADATLVALDRGIGFVVIGAVAVMVAVVSAQVFMRYVLNGSIGWADEVSRLAFVWSIFLAIPLGIRRGSHIGIEILTGALPARARDAVSRAVAASAAAVMALVAYESASLAIMQWDELMMTVDLSAGLFLLPVAVGTAHSCLHLLRIAVAGPYPATSLPEAME